MKYTLIILNLLAAAWMWFFSPINQKADEVHMYSQVRELEQAGVINTNSLVIFLQGKPERLDNPYSLGLATYMHHWKSMRDFFIIPATIAFLGNACLIAIFWKSKKKTDKSVQPPASA
ncbi:MAG: hypothetical protein WC076_13845 [Terrimicrobiaceae bacterium]|jgi:hypothetical protein